MLCFLSKNADDKAPRHFSFSFKPYFCPMPQQTRKVSLGNQPRTVRSADGKLLQVPETWELLKPGDAAITRKTKAAGPSWTIQERKGRKIFSRGVWAPSANIRAAQSAVQLQRNDPAYQHKLQKARAKRAENEIVYQGDFKVTIVKVLHFHPRYASLAERMAVLVSDHATPVGSGTVARTKRIPIEDRAKAAINAWMRHKTSNYDNIAVPRIKGARRELRKKIAKASNLILAKYRSGVDVNSNTCPLYRALS